MKALIIGLLALSSVSSFAAENEFDSEMPPPRYKECWVESHDACPNAASWTCKRYNVYTMDQSNWVTTVARGLSKVHAYEILGSIPGCP